MTIQDINNQFEHLAKSLGAKPEIGFGITLFTLLFQYVIGLFSYIVSPLIMIDIPQPVMHWGQMIAWTIGSIVGLITIYEFAVKKIKKSKDEQSN